MTDVVFENVFPFPLGEARLALETRFPERRWSIVGSGEPIPGNPFHFPSVSVVSGVGQDGAVGAKIVARLGRLPGNTPAHGWSIAVVADPGTPGPLAAQIEIALGIAFARVHDDQTPLRPTGATEWLGPEGASRALLMAEQGRDHLGAALPHRAPAAAPAAPTKPARPRRGPSSLSTMRMPARRPPVDLTGLLGGLNMGEG